MSGLQYFEHPLEKRLTEQPSPEKYRNDDSMNMNAAQQALKSHFGYEAFRLNQAAVVARTLQGESSLVIMPTGGGKSICYQLPAVMLEGLSIVISPLIALMQDQVSALQLSGIQAEALNSSCTSDEEQMIRRRAEGGDLKLLYVSPERAVTRSFLHWIGGLRLAQIAIDEAHCVSIWGNDFRPEYTRLTELTQLFPNIPVAALTATADTATQQDIRQQLNLVNCKTFVSSFERKNIEIDVLPAKKRIQVIQQFLQNQGSHAGIIYCLSRRSTEETAAKLREVGYLVEHYHGAMNSERRAEVQDRFLRDDIQIVCATIAFGMGIDKPNIRWVIHYNLPKNIESYYQEIGRAGRDGEAAKALLFAGFGDMKTLTGFIESSDADERFKQVQLAKLNRLWEFTQTLSCRTNFVLNYFGEHREEECGHCDHCLHPPKSFDGTVLAQKALSACFRIQQRNLAVGMNMLIDVLRGSSSRAVYDSGLHTIKTYGAGKDISWKDWAHYITQLIDRGYLSIDFSQSNTLHLTELSMAVLKEGKSVQLCELIDPKIKQEESKTKVNKHADLSEAERALFDELKGLRKEIADKRKVQSYTIFSDASLKDMSRLKPGNLVAFLKVSGVGDHKCEKYGEAFVSLICNSVDESERLVIEGSVNKKLMSHTPRSDFKMSKLGDTHRTTYELYQQGLPLREIAKARDLSYTTILGHIYRLTFYGKPIDLSEMITADKIQSIQAAWQALHKPDKIKPVLESLGEGYDWEQIRYAVCLAMKETH